MDTRGRRFLLIGMPSWDVRTPLHSLAHVSSIVAEAGWKCTVADLNVKLYNRAAEQDRRRWNESVLWQTDQQYLASLFRQHEASIQDDLASLVRWGEWDLIGFSVKSTTRYFSIRAAQRISVLKPNTPILFGGPDCFPLEFGKAFFEHQQYRPDAILQGEAEVALPKFLAEFERSRGVKRHEAKGHGVKTAVPGFVVRTAEGLDDTGVPELPVLQQWHGVADYSQFDFGAYKAPVYLSTFLSRGCINRCAFCNERPNFRRYRCRKAEDVFREIAASLEWILPHRDRPYFHFSESMVNANLKELEKLCDLIIESGIKIGWGAPAAFSRPIDRPLLEKMKRSGCSYLFWGFESGSRDVLQLIGKNFDPEAARKVLADVSEMGIASQLGLIVGFPGETPQDIVNTLKFVLQYRNVKTVEFPYVSLLVIKVNSLLYQDPDAYGLANRRHRDWWTKDGKNVRGTRLFRSFVLGNGVFNADFSMSHCAKLPAIAEVDYNALPVASEIASTIYLLGVETGRRAEGVEFLQRCAPETICDPSSSELARWHPHGVPRCLRLDAWFRGDKTSSGGKDKIHRLLLELMQALDASQEGVRVETSPPLRRAAS